MTDLETPGLQLLDIDDAEAGLIAYTVGGKITAEQTQEIWDRVDAAAEGGRKLRFYCEMHGFPTAESSVYIEKLKHVGKLMKTIERMAIVGDQRWIGAYTKIMDPITKPDLRHFTSEQVADARAWIRE
jgi:SpoIIAA-like